MKDFNELIEEKKKSDSQQRRKSVAILLLSLTALAIVYFITARTNKENIQLSDKVSSTQGVMDSIKRELKDTIQYISESLKSDIIESTGLPNGRKRSNGLPLYTITMKVIDKSVVSKLKKVEYYFADNTYSPKLKSSENASDGFSIKITDTWGCMTEVPVYLHYKDNTIDTLIFPMCDKTMLELRFN